MQCSDFGPEISGETLELFQKKYGEQPFLKNQEWMAQMAAFRMERESGSWCRIPFSSGIERDDQLMALALGATEALHKRKHPVCLQITGAVTLLMEEMGSREMIRCYRKQEELFWTLLNRMVDKLVLYAQKAVELGAKMISYGDPSGNQQIMGPDFFQKVTNLATKKFYDQLNQHHQGCILHLCPQLTVALLDSNQIIRTEKRREPGCAYGDYLLELSKGLNQVLLTGDRCIKQERIIISSIPVFQWIDGTQK